MCVRVCVSAVTARCNPRFYVRSSNTHTLTKKSNHFCVKYERVMRSNDPNWSSKTIQVERITFKKFFFFVFLLFCSQILVAVNITVAGTASGGTTDTFRLMTSFFFRHFIFSHIRNIVRSVYFFGSALQRKRFQFNFDNVGRRPPILVTNCMARDNRNGQLTRPLSLYLSQFPSLSLNLVVKTIRRIIRVFVFLRKWPLRIFRIIPDVLREPNKK